MMRRWKQDWLSGNEGKWVNIWRVEHKRPPCRVCCMCVYYAWAVKKHSSHTLSTHISMTWSIYSRHCHAVCKNSDIPSKKISHCLYIFQIVHQMILFMAVFSLGFSKKIFMLSSQGLIFSGILKGENWNIKYLTFAHKIKFSRLNWLTSHHI